MDLIRYFLKMTLDISNIVVTTYWTYDLLNHLPIGIKQVGSDLHVYLHTEK